MKNIVVESLLNYDIPGLCSIIEFSSDYSTESVIYSKLILNEAGYDSPKTEKQFSKFKTKKNITESEIQRLKGEFSKIYTRRESVATKTRNVAAKKESATNNINQNSSNADIESYVEKAGLKLKLKKRLIPFVIIYIILFYLFGVIFHLTYVNSDIFEARRLALMSGNEQIAKSLKEIKFYELTNIPFAFGYFLSFSRYLSIHFISTFVIELIGFSAFLYSKKKFNLSKIQSNKNESTVDYGLFKIKNERKISEDEEIKKSKAKKKLLELKEYFDEGIITKEEYEKAAKPHKKILLEL